MKSYTDLEQSKMLSGILPIESADMHYATWTILDDEFIVSPNQGSTIKSLQEDYGNQIIPCWSLAALLDILSDRASSIDEDANVILSSYKTVEWWDLSICNSVLEDVTKSDPIDACVEMILKLHEEKLL